MGIFDERLLRVRPCLISDKEFVYETKRIAMSPSVEKIWGKWDEGYQRGRFNKFFNPDLTQIIQYSGQDIGALIVEDEPNSIQVDNIQILPEFQNRGIGSFLLIQIIKKAKKSRKTVTLQVLKSNLDAKKLYERLEFKVIRETEYHYQLKRE
jgi:ribosomal protein S18 acetylase RimI-like enzyme